MVRVACVPHPPSPQMVMVIRSCSSMAAVSSQAIARLQQLLCMSRSRDCAVASLTVVALTRSVRPVVSRVQLVQAGGTSHCMLRKQTKEKGMVLDNKRSERTTRVFPGIRRQRARNAKGVSSRLEFPGGDQLVWASRPSCTLARDRRHDFREGSKLGCPTVCRNFAS
jgi:hypothetical protein